MKAIQVSLLAAAILLGRSSGWSSTVVVETFDTDPATRGWVGVNNTSGGNNFGFVASNGSGNNVGTDAASGEAGGFFNRSATESTHGVSVSGSLTLTNAFSATGGFDITSQHVSGDGYLAGIGFYSASPTDRSFAGLLFAEPGGGSTGPRLFSWIYFGDGTVRASSMESLGALDAADETFSFTYDPAASGNLGALTVSLTGVTASGTGNANLTASLLAGQKTTKPIVLDRFGLFTWAPFLQSGNDVTFFMDDVTYTSLIPEPTMMLLAGLGLLLLWCRRWQRL